MAARSSLVLVTVLNWAEQCTERSSNEPVLFSSKVKTFLVPALKAILEIHEKFLGLHTTTAGSEFSIKY
jgi:hypothetical protein